MLCSPGNPFGNASARRSTAWSDTSDPAVVAVAQMTVKAVKEKAISV